MGGSKKAGEQKTEAENKGAKSVPNIRKSRDSGQLDRKENM